ncbi:T9SS type A sorting domain-containing protein [Dyadobacter sandarakinus]|uniref:T9SS type A sorting domain-containing protein n=1 Tax=Dyadobacter sandarakinus TaxID=2747268 RepID=A0ABX7I266_9BACT|nr:T9SS type A sorting domain-containing protein [Dyadobacter sandarakinus]QRQ99631.1 T9SS type A sorting domain-containing protein [Dyadobacter sandarakinus]
MKSIYLFLLLLLISGPAALATHLRGGEILASHVSGQTFDITVRVYFDRANGGGAADSQQLVSVCFGDGDTATFSRKSYTDLPGLSGIAVGDYVGRHTFPSADMFQVSVSLNNRVNSLNLTNSQNKPMFLWTIVNTKFSNATPVLPYLNFEAGIRQVFSVDLTPRGTESDSVSVRVQRLSGASPGTCGVRMLEKGYVYPNEISAKGIFKIDPAQKKLVWQAPEVVGVYLYAIVVDEWRDGAKISESYREGAISVTDKGGPTVEIPPYESAEDGGVITSNPGLDGQGLSLSIEAYPNPTDSYVNAKVYSRNRAVISMQLIDLKGRILRKTNTKAAVVATDEVFDLSRLPSGIYLIKADNGTDTVTQKVMH